MDERRGEVRSNISPPDIISAQFVIEKGPYAGNILKLNVRDCSEHGLGLLVTENDFIMLKHMKPGEKIRHMTLYAEWALLIVDVEIHHISKISTGTYKGFHLLGVKSNQLIRICKKEKD